jgi:hypothetical protein
MRESQSVPEEEVKFKGASQEQIDTAHDHANMVKAEAGHGPVKAYGGKGRDYAHSELRFRYEDNQGIQPITPEEYDKANQAIQELEATITDQNGLKKVLSKIGYGTLAILAAAVEILTLGTTGADVENAFRKVMSKETLNKAKVKLEEMRKQGKGYGEESARVHENIKA